MNKEQKQLIIDFIVVALIILVATFVKYGILLAIAYIITYIVIHKFTKKPDPVTNYLILDYGVGRLRNNY